VPDQLPAKMRIERHVQGTQTEQGREEETAVDAEGKEGKQEVEEACGRHGSLDRSAVLTAQGAR
jgi:hypothetical protein